MKNFLKSSITPLVIGTIAAILVFIDSLVAPLFIVGASFTWMAFVNWTVFFSASGIDRLKAIIGYIIGFLSANAIIYISNYLGNFIGISIIASVIAVFIINALVMYFDRAKKLFLDSIPGIFVGIALTFSRAGVSMQSSDLRLLAIIIIYGILGLLCGLGTNFFVKKISERIEKAKI